MEFSKKEYCSGLPFPSPGDLPDLGIKPMSFVAPVLAGAFFKARATAESSGILHKRAMEALMKKEIDAFKKDLKSFLVWG